MESNNREGDMLQELEKLRLEKQLLLKHVFVLNDCLSTDELKRKISDLEKKEEMLISLKGVVERLRVETEPLNYLKSVLEKKISAANEAKITGSESLLDLQPIVPEIDLNLFNLPTDCKSSPSQSTQSIPEQTKIDLTSSIKNNEIKNLLASAEEGHFGNIDEYTQLMEQYDVVTIEEILKEIKDVGILILTNSICFI